MKKFALTFVALVFGSGLAFAQSTPENNTATTENTVHPLTLDKLSNQPAEEEDRRTISEWALPETVVEQIKYSELSGHTILRAMEVEVESEGNTSIQYELLLQDNISQEGAEPVLLVRYDKWGERLFQRPATTLAISERK